MSPNSPASPRRHAHAAQARLPHQCRARARWSPETILGLAREIWKLNEATDHLPRCRAPAAHTDRAQPAEERSSDHSRHAVRSFHRRHPLERSCHGHPLVFFVTGVIPESELDRDAPPREVPLRGRRQVPASSQSDFVSKLMGRSTVPAVVRRGQRGSPKNLEPISSAPHGATGPAEQRRKSAAVTRFGPVPGWPSRGATSSPCGNASRTLSAGSCAGRGFGDST